MYRTVKTKQKSKRRSNVIPLVTANILIVLAGLLPLPIMRTTLVVFYLFGCFAGLQVLSVTINDLKNYRAYGSGLNRVDGLFFLFTVMILLLINWRGSIVIEPIPILVLSFYTFLGYRTMAELIVIFRLKQIKSHEK